MHEERGGGGGRQAEEGFFGWDGNVVNFSVRSFARSFSTAGSVGGLQQALSPRRTDMSVDAKKISAASIGSRWATAR